MLNPPILYRCLLLHASVVSFGPTEGIAPSFILIWDSLLISLKALRFRIVCFQSSDVFIEDRAVENEGLYTNESTISCKTLNQSIITDRWTEKICWLCLQLINNENPLNVWDLTTTHADEQLDNVRKSHEIGSCRGSRMRDDHFLTRLVNSCSYYIHPNYVGWPNYSQIEMLNRANRWRNRQTAEQQVEAVETSFALGNKELCWI